MCRVVAHNLNSVGAMVILRIELGGVFRLLWKFWKRKIKKMTGSGPSIINTRNCESQTYLHSGASGDSHLIPKVTLQASSLDQIACWPRLSDLGGGT